jgi:hypothetical protein
VANVSTQQLAIVSQGSSNYRRNLAAGNHRYHNVITSTSQVKCRSLKFIMFYVDDEKCMRMIKELKLQVCIYSKFWRLLIVVLSSIIVPQNKAIKNFLPLLCSSQHKRGNDSFHLI